MERNMIASLRCPYTGSPFELTTVLREQGSVIDFGIVTSEAGHFPIISGILRLLSDELQEPLSNLVKEGQEEEAILGALELPFSNRRSAVMNRLWHAIYRRNLGAVVKNMVRPSKRRLYRLVTEADISFADLVDRCREDRWANWQMHRFSMPKFLAVHALSYLAKNYKTVLDFGSGLGHAAFLIKRLASEALVVCADYSFTSLYLAKRFLVPDALCVCLDGDYPLPFSGQYFGCVFSTDALQYIESKIGLAKEFQRIISHDGTIVLPHLHNRLSPVDVGKPLTPFGYDGLFDGIVRRIYPEDEILANYVSDGSLDLDRRWSLDDLRNSLDGLSLVAANSESVFKVYEGIWDAHINTWRHPNLNPAYRARKSGNSWVLEKIISAPYAAEYIIQNCEVLPKTWRIAIESLDSSEILALRDADRAQVRELVRRFLILDMPERYM